MLITFPGTRSTSLVILFFILFTLSLPLGKRKLALMIPWINYIELHWKAFPNEEKGQPSRRIFLFSYNGTFLRELKVQKKPTFFFSATVYYRFREYVCKRGEIEWFRKLDFQTGLTTAGARAILTPSPFAKTQNTLLWKTCTQTIPYSKMTF